MPPYILALQKLFEARADPDNAFYMKKYMREKFDYLGLKTPQRREISRQFFSDSGLPEPENIDDVVLQLWDLPEREYQYFALDMLDKVRNKLAAEAIEMFERLIVSKSWWDTVDRIATHLVGGHFKRFPDLRQPCLSRYRKSGNFWIRRTAILFQLNYKQETDTELLFAIIRENNTSDEFFIQKAIGWALRELSKTDPASVRQFIDTTELAPLSKREGLKWLAKR
jgi:3-methyladenine DNA glycosylase AlkD